MEQLLLVSALPNTNGVGLDNSVVSRRVGAREKGRPVTGSTLGARLRFRVRKRSIYDTVSSTMPLLGLALGPRSGTDRKRYFPSSVMPSNVRPEKPPHLITSPIVPAEEPASVVE